MSIVVMFFGVIGAFIVGVSLGAGTSGGFQSRRNCGECRRRMVEEGFYYGGKKYCAEPEE